MASNIQFNAAEHVLTLDSGLSDLSDKLHRKSANTLELFSSEKSTFFD